MTSVVKVSAHCANTKQVRIVIDNPANTAQQFILLQDGETAEQVVYDDMTISVKEELKPT